MIEPIRIGIADDHHLFRKGIIQLCESIKGFEVIVEAANGRVLIDILSHSSELPDVVLLDLNMPELDGIEMTRHIRKNFPGIKIVILTVYKEERFIIHLLECGANAYLLKECELDELERAIRSVVNDGYYFPEPILRIINNNSLNKRQRISDSNPFLDITEREKEVLLLICEELTAAEIGEKLFVSTRTVEGHRNNLLSKTGCKNIAGLVIFAIRNGLYLPRF